MEIITLGEGKISRWSPDETGRWAAEQLTDGLKIASGSGSQIAAQDIDGNGELDLVINHADGWSVLNAESGESLFESPWQDSAAKLALVANDTNGLSVVAPQSDEPPILWSPGKGLSLIHI